ncbi:MAG: DUF512 domain-containing protein [Lachnospiraceae bacterium]|nr:DUF512 domain-containing protein [Lachnospiraceae bacterium]
MPKKAEHKIIKVHKDSIAEELQIEPGDVLLTINDEVIDDIFDYQYLIKDEYLEILIRKANGEEWLLDIEKDYDDDLGMDFENSLMSEYRSCSNKCIFCFIDQMPKGMRETLYFKDDDSRLSFLQGNYITMTNMKEKDINRIIRFNLAPINISVQTTNPELRCMMLHNRFAGNIMTNLQKLYEGHIEMNGQIVLCKNVNDGDELVRSINDLSKFLPFMRSVSVVPAGITKFREGLYPLETFTKEDACKVIDTIESRQQEFFDKFGLHFIHASDEWYITAERDFPDESQYDGYIQLENGVGMMRLFIEEFHEALNDIKKKNKKKPVSIKKKTLTITTGALTYKTICTFSDAIMKVFPQITINVVKIINNFFGETITVTGLITATDIIDQLLKLRAQGTDLGKTLHIPINMLRMGEDVFLDDLTITDVEKALNMKIVVNECNGKAFVDSMLYNKGTKRNNSNFNYIKSFDE